MKQKKLINSFSIIAGKYKHLKFNFIATDDLRPTPNRIRETLFNWLAFDIAQKSVLDCFAGSGALGFEAISRGATKVLLIEKHKAVFKQIDNNINILKDNNIKAKNSDIFMLGKIKKSFDFVFLDPPFKQNLITQTIEFLIKNNYINRQTVIYLESEYLMQANNLKILKQKKASSVYYALAKIKDI